jgi:hypothetical protein
MLISTKSINLLSDNIRVSSETFCSGLFLSARWFVVSQLDYDGFQMIVLPDKDSAEYCAADLYNLVEGDRIFFLPDSGKTLERSNYKSTLGVQRTSAIGKILEYKEGKRAVTRISMVEGDGICNIGIGDREGEFKGMGERIYTARVFAQAKPQSVTVGGTAVAFDYDGQFVTFELGGEKEAEIVF